MLIHDLGVDHSDNALEVLARQRQAWRIDQTRAAVASLPDVAADVLRDSGYAVSPPDKGDQPANDLPAWLSRY